jgi:Sulfate permease family
MITTVSPPVLACQEVSFVAVADVVEKVQRWAPGVGIARGYQRRWLRADLVAGLVLATILVPQGMAYAELAGLPTKHQDPIARSRRISHAR